MTGSTSRRAMSGSTGLQRGRSTNTQTRIGDTVINIECRCTTMCPLKPSFNTFVADTYFGMLVGWDGPSENRNILRMGATGTKVRFL